VLFSCQTKSNRKFDDPAVKCAIFGSLHAPPSSYATRFPSFTSTSLQYGQARTCKSGSPSGLGTLRISFIVPPHEAQRRIGRLSAKTIIATPQAHPMEK